VMWTSPYSDQRTVKLTVTAKNQIPSGSDYAKTLYLAIAGNRRPMATKSVPMGTTPATFETEVAVGPGDTLDFWFSRPDDLNPGQWLPSSFYPPTSISLQVVVSPGSAIPCNSIADISTASDGAVVIMNTPVSLASSTLRDRSFDKRYGVPTVGSEYSFYVQNSDRTQGIKCVSDGTIPNLDCAPPVPGTGKKIKFTGTIVRDSLGKKVVQISSINATVDAAPPAPLGKVGKAVTDTGTLVKVWGKIIPGGLVTNTGSDSSQWRYEYIVINDGSQDMKIPMHVQCNNMAGDTIITDLAVGRYIAVTGIATIAPKSTGGTEVVVMPRNVSDITDYTNRL
jgi:hypothetical protein